MPVYQNGTKKSQLRFAGDMIWFLLERSLRSAGARALALGLERARAAVMIALIARNDADSLPNALGGADSSFVSGHRFRPWWELAA